jgi:hypothetical protein
MRTRLVIGIAAGAFGALALACSNSSSPDPYASVDEFCTAYAKAVCQVVSSTSCGLSASAADTCQSYQSNSCNQNAVQATASGTRQYKSGNVQPCIDALNGAYGNNPSAVSLQQLTDINTKCEQVFQGSAGNGAACTSNYDCTQSGEICATAPGVGSVCATPTQKNDGDFCADPGDQCPSTDYCAPMSGTSKCVAAPTQGQPCSASTPCNRSNHCFGGTCQTLAAQGAPCSTTADCVSGQMCDTYTSAALPTPTCEPGLSFGRGSPDCLGIVGQGTIPQDAGGPTVNDAGSDANASTDAPTGG